MKKLHTFLSAVLLGASLFAADLNQGISLVNDKSFAEATRTLRTVIQDEPDNERAHYYLGLALLGEKKPGEAAQELQKADELAPGKEDTLVALARAYVEDKQFDKAQEPRDLLHTLATGCWAIGLLLGGSIALMAPAISGSWLRADALGPSAVRDAVQMMGLIIALQWPLSVYQGGLLGLQRHVLLNVLRILSATINTGGAVLALWFFSRHVETFFLWQIVGSLLQVVLMAMVLWRCMPQGDRPPRLDIELLRDNLPFMRGMTGIAFLGALLSQMDKIILSRSLTLTEFGYYTVAGMVAASLQLFITPIFSAIFPRLSALVAVADTDAIRRLYHAGTQLMAACVLPTSIVLAMYAPQCIRLWTGDAGLAVQVAPIAILLLTGAAINGLMHLPYALQLAHGWTRLGVKISLYEALVFGPLLVWAASRFGALGGAAVWVVLNICYLIAGLFLTHRRLLQGEMWRWIVDDIGYPLGAVVGVVAMARLLLPSDVTGLPAAALFTGVGISAVFWEKEQIENKTASVKIADRTFIGVLAAL